MTKHAETAREIRTALDTARGQLVKLEARHSAAADREQAARTERSAALIAEAGSYRPDLTAEVDAAAAERRALEEAIEAARNEIASMKSRLEDAEQRESVAERDRLQADAITAWEALDKELMKYGPQILKLHDAARDARNAFADAAVRTGRNWPHVPTPPMLEQVMLYLRPYLEGEPQREAEKARRREERREKQTAAV